MLLGRITRIIIQTKYLYEAYIMVFETNRKSLKYYWNNQKQNKIGNTWDNMEAKHTKEKGKKIDTYSRSMGYLSTIHFVYATIW